MTVPTDLLYTTDHEWVRTQGAVATVGITAYASSALGDVVFIGLPTVGEAVTVGQACGEIESTKSVSDLSSPVAGEVVEVNQALADEPGLANSDPYRAGWLFRVRVQGPVDDLLDAAAYTTLTEEA